MNKKAIISELSQAAKTYVRPTPWTNDQLEILKMFAGKVPRALLAQKLGRPESSIKAKISDMRRVEPSPATPLA